MRSDSWGDGLTMAGYDIAAQPFKNVLQSNFTRDIINEVQSASGVNRRDTPKTFMDKMLYDFYGMDFYQKEKTDRFGNTYPKTGKYSQWVDGYYDTYKDNPEVQLLFKFETGVGTGKFKAKEEYNFQGITMKLNEDQRAEMETIHQREYKQGVLDEIDELNDLEEKLDLERDLKRIKNVSLRVAKEEILDKYFLDSE
jgi:hypothetical protein